MSKLNRFLEFRSKFDSIDEKKLELEKNEIETKREFMRWAENYFTRDVREHIIQLCIEKKLPDWRLQELKNSHTKWEKSKENLSIADVSLFAEIQINHSDGFQKDKKSRIKKMVDFMNWGGL